MEFFFQDEEREALRAWLHPRCQTRGEFEFWDAFYDDLTDMFDGFADGDRRGVYGDPVTWYFGLATAEHSESLSYAYAQEQRFHAEAWERGYDLR